MCRSRSWIPFLLLIVVLLAFVVAGSCSLTVRALLMTDIRRVTHYETFSPFLTPSKEVLRTTSHTYLYAPLNFGNDGDMVTGSRERVPTWLGLPVPGPSSVGDLHPTPLPQMKPQHP
jgi:hypothetical protein